MEIEQFSHILHKKFETSYPDTFVKSRAIDKEVYDSANGAMYTWYIFILNKISKHNLSPKYSQTPEERVNMDWSCYDRFFVDFEASENWQAFLFEHLIISPV